MTVTPANVHQRGPTAASRHVVTLVETVLASSRRRGALATLALTVLLAPAVYRIVRPLARALDTAVVSANPGWYLEMAANLAWCNRYPYITSTGPENQAKVNLMDVHVERVGDRSVRSLAVVGAGSIAEYCQIRGQRVALAEPSMVVLESALLTMFRRITVAGLAWGLTWIAAAEIAVFAFGCLLLRWPLLFAGALATAALYLTTLLGSTALYSQYRMMLPTLLFGIGIGAGYLGSDLRRHPSALLVTAFVLGVWLAFTGNLRTSLYPEALAISGLYLAAAALGMVGDGMARRKVAALTAGGLVALTAGAAAFDQPFIAPQRASEGPSYHTVFHNVVIGLAVPPSALSQREQLEWFDGAGARAAKKVDPNVQYLGPGYDQALSKYYLGLWKTYPREMMALYQIKIGLARRTAEAFLASEQQGLYWFVKDGRWMTFAAWPALRIAAVVGVAGVFALLIAAGLFRPRFADLDIARGFLLAAVGIAGLLNFAENVATMADIVLPYSTIFLFGLMFSGLFAYQSVIDAGWSALVTHVRHRR